MIKKLLARDNAKKVTHALATQIIKTPFLTEKTAKLAQNAVVTFVVDKAANKCDIKKAAELVLGGKVLSVNTMITKPRLRGFKGKFARRQSIKKAIVTFERTEDMNNILEKGAL